MKKILLLSFLFAGLAFMAFGQNRFKRKGDLLYEQLAYEKAIDYYEHYLKKTPGDTAVVLRLANCYRLTKNYKKSAEAYAEVVKLPYFPDICWFYYGHALMEQRDFDGAREAFGFYAALRPDDPRGKNFLDGLDRYDRLMQDSIRYTIEEMPFNTPFSDFGAIPYNGNLVFSSSRNEGSPIAQDFDWLLNPFLTFYYTSEKDSGSMDFSRPLPLKGNIESKYHESNFTWAESQDRVYFTRNSFYNRKAGKDKEGVIKLNIYSAEMDEMKAVNVEEFPYNNDEYSVTHPSLSKDGQTFYFTSDMPGGFGGKDIYFCNWLGDSWGAPVNMGPLVNTPGDEQFPFEQADGTFYFASDGHPGLGHLDIFKLREWGGDIKVFNLGYPINTAYDDFSFWIAEDGENGYFASNRPGGTGDDDIYKFHLQLPQIQLLVLDSLRPDIPLDSAEITVVDERSGEKATYYTDGHGYIQFKAEFGEFFDATAQKGDYEPGSVKMNTLSEEPKMLFEYEIRLALPPPAVSAIVVDIETNEPIPDADAVLVKMTRAGMDSIKTKTNEYGLLTKKMAPNTYYEFIIEAYGYFPFSERRSTSQFEYLTDTFKLIPIRPGVPYVLDNVHFDFDKWDIKAESFVDLEKLSKILGQYPDIRIELSAHTDSRGSDLYNERLSRKRALSTKRHLELYFGIDGRRIEAAGYGEYRLSNECADGVYCEEWKHRENRRTEFKILGVIAGLDESKSRFDTDEEEGEPIVLYTKSGELQGRYGDPIWRPADDGDLSNRKNSRKNRRNWRNRDQSDTKNANNRGNRREIDDNYVWNPADTAGTPANVDDSNDLDFNNPILPEYKPADPAITSGTVVYRIQIGAFGSEKSPNNFKDLFEFKSYLVGEYIAGFHKYFVGEYVDYARAREGMMHVRGYGYKGAFVTAWKDGAQLARKDWPK